MGLVLEERPSQSRSPAKVGHWLIALPLAALLLYLSLRGIQWREVWKALLNAKPAFVGLNVLAGIVALFIRSVRWRVLLSSGAPVSVGTAFWATSAGYFGNNYLPARAGELIRTFYVSGRTGLPKSFVLTTALTERLSDAVALVLISSVVLLTLPYRPGWFANAARPFTIISFCGVAAIVLVPLLERLWRHILARLPLSAAVGEKFSKLLDHILTGIRAFHDWKRLLVFTALTLVIWFLDAFGAVALMRSLGMQGTLSIAFLLITSMGLGSALPSTPGYVGIYQFVAVSVLVPFGFSRTDAIAYILLVQALQYVLTAVVGLIAFSRVRVPNWRSLREPA